MALVLRVWTRTGDEEITAEAVSCYPSAVRALVESAERLLAAMTEVFNVDTEDVPPDTESPSNAERIGALVQMVSAGLDESAATLTLISGVGPKHARSLLKLGISDMEDLAGMTEDDLEGLPKVSRERKARWIEQAEELVKTRSAFFFRDDGPHIASNVLTWESHIDPYRFRRALDLKVEPGDSGEYRVTGGLDPHMVVTTEGNLLCDCADAGKGNVCKHQLAVRLARGDEELEKLKLQVVKGVEGSSGVGLSELWLSQSKSDLWRVL